MLRSDLMWAVALLLAGSAAVALCVTTAPVVSADAPRDFFDSPFLLPSFAVLALLSGLAGWFAPRLGFVWGLAAAAPFFAYFAAGVVRDLRGGGGQGLWPVGLIFLVGLTLVPVAAAVTTRIVVRNR